MGLAHESYEKATSSAIFHLVITTTAVQQVIYSRAAAEGMTSRDDVNDSV